MAVTLTVNGVGYSYPQTGDQIWGSNSTGWATAVTNGMLQKAGGNFTLTANVNFGSTYGLLTAFYQSQSSNTAGTGVVRLANNSDAISWRNAANSADLALLVNASNQLQFNGSSFLTTTGTLNNSIALVTNGSGVITSSATTSTQIGYLGTCGSNVYGFSDTITVTNKSIGDPTDSTKALGFLLSAATTSTKTTLSFSQTANRTISFQDATDTVVMRATTDTLTNKTIAGGSNTISGITVGMQSSGAATSGQVPAASGAGAVSWVNPVFKNFLVNGNFDFWQRGTSTTIANGATGYQPDRWYGKNSLGTLGVLTLSQTTGVSTGALYGCKLQITTAPNAAQANGCELYQTLENFDSLALYNQTASFTVQVKSFGNVNQVGVQFFYKTTEAKVDTSIGSEVLTTVNTSTFTACTINGQALGTSQTTSGVIGVRIRITAVSSGNTYDLNNGFVVEQAMLNLGATAYGFVRAGLTIQQELSMCERYYEKSYALATAPGTITNTNVIPYNATATGTDLIPGGCRFRTKKRATPTFHCYSSNSGTIDKVYDISGAADRTASYSNTGDSSAGEIDVASSTSGHNTYFHYTADSEI